jgi:hypothetical protein
MPGWLKFLDKNVPGRDIERGGMGGLQDSNGAIAAGDFFACEDHCHQAFVSLHSRGARIIPDRLLVGPG